jgi:hypothetical protein
MAFCNSCGANITASDKFCSKCGAAITGGPTAGVPVAGGLIPAVPPSPTAKSGGSALKTVLIVVGVLVAIGVLSLVAITFAAFHFARNSHVTQEGDRVNVQTPFGNISANDPEQAVRDLGVEIYPGAEAQKTGSSSATIGGMRTVSVFFTSPDSVEKVCDFYKSKFPDSTVKTSSESSCTIVSRDPGSGPGDVVTVNVEADGDGSRFHITRVSKKKSSDE